mgnify:CR=1 FL=1|tara:strand:+ start:1011 stop:1676 length:666 start_codon:yes stop_codon:yes gene_type:complete
MKKIITILILPFLFLQCFQSKKQKTDCSTTAKINQTEVCLPNIKGLTNISKNKKYESYIKQFTIQGNEMLAFYLDNSLINEVTTPKYNYASVYVNSQLKKDINKSEFKKMSNTMGYYLKKSNNLETIIKEIERNYLKNISLDNPVVIDSYSLNKNIKTYLLLGKMIEYNTEIVTLTTLNLMHIQKKMVLSNYIIKYNNSNSINEIKQKNDYFVMRILDENK